MQKKSGLVLVLSLLVSFLLIGYYYYSYHYLPTKSFLIQNKQAIDSSLISYIYGIPADSFHIVESKIGRDQTITDILESYIMPEGWRAQVIQIPREKLDMSKIRAGNKYTVFLTRDTIPQLRYFVYEHTPVDFVKLAFGDSSYVERGEKQVTIVERKATGIINTSLWNAMVDKNLDPMLANELSDIYAWSIDFFGLQVNDSFKVVFDEHYVDAVLIGLGKIHTAIFYHAGTDFYAIPFVQDSIESFYDLEGNSLRKAFLKAPLSFSRISSGFSNSRLHPVLKIRRPHHGVDYAAPAGTPVQAIGDGKIISADGGYNRGGGNMIKIRHNAVYTTAYLHLKGFAKGIRVGEYVKQGDVIGYVGSSGLSTGPHLDFRFYKNGQPINPLTVDAPPVEPILEKNKLAFDSVKTVYLGTLKSF